MNIITWADSPEAAREKIAWYFERFGWQVVGVEEGRVLPLDFVADDEEFQDMFERACNYPDAIICGTFHSFKTN
jgi:hypothetical protein